MKHHEDTIESVGTMMGAFGQEVRTNPSVPTVEEMTLRLRLELEELQEKAKAMGLEGTFANMCNDVQLETANMINDTEQDLSEDELKELSYENFLFLANDNIVDLGGVLDACIDQRVVNDGTINAFGFQEVFKQGFDIVQDNNMTKVCSSETHAMETVAKYQNEQVFADIRRRTYNGVDYITVHRMPDGKFLKPTRYVSCEEQLRKLVE